MYKFMYDQMVSHYNDSKFTKDDLINMMVIRDLIIKQDRSSAERISINGVSNIEKLFQMISESDDIPPEIKEQNILASEYLDFIKENIQIQKDPLRLPLITKKVQESLDKASDPTDVI